jgi:hypothetical protein
MISDSDHSREGEDPSPARRRGRQGGGAGSSEQSDPPDAEAARSTGSICSERGCRRTASDESRSRSASTPTALGRAISTRSVENGSAGGAPGLRRRGPTFAGGPGVVGVPAPGRHPGADVAPGAPPDVPGPIAQLGAISSSSVGISIWTSSPKCHSSVVSHHSGRAARSLALEARPRRAVELVDQGNRAASGMKRVGDRRRAEGAAPSR